MAVSVWTRRVWPDTAHAVLAASRSRLVRDPGRALLEMAAGKVHNLRLAARALDGIVIDPDEILSFWYLVGEPSEARGFRKGMELRSGCIVPSVGGGLCQLAGALFEVALRAGLTILEHHPHSLELAAELWQVWRSRETGVTQREHRVLAAEVPVMEAMPAHHCYTCDRPCPNAVAPDDPEANAVRREA